MEDLNRGFSGSDRIRLAQALSRARLVSFESMDWNSFAGAVGDAHMVHFHKDDADHFRAVLGISHWPEECTVVILDEAGITWNGFSPVNSLAWQVQVGFDVQIHDVGDADEFWTPSGDSRDGSWGDKSDLRIASLPEEIRQLVMACPHEARPYVLDGYEQQAVKAGYGEEPQHPTVVSVLETLSQVDLSKWKVLLEFRPADPVAQRK